MAQKHKKVFGNPRSDGYPAQEGDGTMSVFALFDQLAEERIREAQERGEFDDLAGKGKPLVFEDDSMVPEDLRMAYKVLKNSGHLPPEVDAERDIRSTADLLHHAEDEQERCRQMRKLNYLMSRLGASRSMSLKVQDDYYNEIVQRVSVPKKDSD
jgi:hypothetical protein